MSTTYYHVAPAGYVAGDDLLCWNCMVAFGRLTEDDWKWDTAPIASDGHLVSLFSEDQMADAEWLIGEIAGQLLKVTIPDDAITDNAELDWDDEDEDRIYITTIREQSYSHPAILARIPGKYIEVVK